MSLKDDWSKTGKSMGTAFGGLGKNIGRSVKTGIGKGADALDDEKKSEGEAEQKSTVFNDGSWRTTGKNFGKAFKGLGRSLLHSAQALADKLEDDDESDTPALADDTANNDENPTDAE